MNLWALLVAAIGVIAVGKALVIGSASVDGEGFRRDEEPMLYWSIVAASCLLVIFLIYVAPAE